MYPTLSPQQLDAMRQRRLTSNCAPSQLQYREPAAHQAKHIMMCRCVRVAVCLEVVSVALAAGNTRLVLTTASWLSCLPCGLHLPTADNVRSGSSCKSACKPCGSTGPSNGERCWEYLSHRLAELNQLCSQDDEQQPILCSKLNCLQVGWVLLEGVCLWVSGGVLCFVVVCAVD